MSNENEEIDTFENRELLKLCEKVTGSFKLLTNEEYHEEHGIREYEVSLSYGENSTIFHMATPNSWIEPDIYSGVFYLIYQGNFAAMGYSTFCKTIDFAEHDDPREMFEACKVVKGCAQDLFGDDLFEFIDAFNSGTY